MSKGTELNVLINKRLLADGKYLYIRSSGHTMNMTVAELREELRERGLKISGRKHELIKRLKHDL